MLQEQQAPKHKSTTNTELAAGALPTQPFAFQPLWADFVCEVFPARTGNLLRETLALLHFGDLCVVFTDDVALLYYALLLGLLGRARRVRWGSLDAHCDWCAEVALMNLARWIFLGKMVSKKCGLINYSRK